MRLRDAAKWIKEKITGKKTEETPVLTPMIATEEDIEKAKEMDREIEEMEKKSALMAPIVTSQAEMERLQRFEADSKQIAEMAGKPHEEVAEAILKVTTETPASLEEATQQVHERMELQAEVAAETKEESGTPFVQRWAEAKGMTVQELEQETGWTAEQLEQNIIGRRRKGIPMVRRQQLLRAEVCWGVLILILLAVAALALSIVGMTLYFHYQLKDGRTRREYTEEQKRADEEQIQAIREMQARREEKRQKRRQRKSKANRR